MNLLSRISLTYIVVSLLFLTVGGYFFYVIFKHEVYEELDEQLRDEKRNIDRLIKYSDEIPLFFSEVNTNIEIVPVKEGITIKLQRKDTIINHPYEGNIPFRQWRYTLKSNKENYLVTVRKSLVDLSDLSEKIIYSIIIGFITLLLSSALVNFFVLKFVLRPLYKTINQLQKYSIGIKGAFKAPETNTKEFRELNKAIEIMTQRIEQDYNKIKEFTENASHEIQTPVAIVQNKLELLIQSEPITESQAELIQAAYEGIARLSRLNQALIFLTRIENKEYSVTEKVDFGNVTKRLINQAEEKLEMKSLKISIEESSPFIYSLNASLAESLIFNLLNNAIRYTEKGGEIKVVITNNKFTISNSGKALTVVPDKLFQRFFKLSSDSNSLGIGLSLVKTIAQAYGLKISYSYLHSTHSFSLEA